MAFNTEVSYYAGSIASKDTHIAKFLVNGVQWIINLIEKSNPDMLPLFAKTQVLNNSAPTLTLATNAKILDVVRINANSNGEALKCSPINPAYRSNAANTDSIYYASVNSPVYYIDSTSGNAPVLTILPTPEATQTATISMVLPASSVAADATAIDNFPSELYHGVVLYAAGQLLHHKMSEFNAKLPTDLDADVTVFDAIADIGKAAAVGTTLPVWNTTSSLPSSITLDSSLPADFAVGTSLPTFNLSATLSGEYASAITQAQELIDVGLSTNEASGSGDDSVAYSVGYWLKDGDDEMTQTTLAVASQELQRASTYLQKFQSDVNNEVTEFQNDIAAYQADVQKTSAEVNAAAQKVSSEIASDQAIEANEAAIYQAEIAKEQSRFNAEITKYSAEVAKANQDIQYELAEWNANLQKKISLYTTIIGKLTTDYQWLQGQYQVVKAELSEFLTPYTSAVSLDSTAEGVRR